MKIKNLFFNSFLAFLSFSCLTSVSLVAQTPEYYFMSSSTVTGNYFPFASFGTSGDHVQLLYHPSDFNTTPVAGMIDTIYFYTWPSWTSNSPVTYTDLTVKIGTSAVSSFASSNWITGLQTALPAQTKTYTGLTAGQWFAIPLDNPVSYDGTSNLVIDVSQTAYTNNGIIILIDYNSSAQNRRIYGTTGTTSGTADDEQYSFGFHVSPSLTDAGMSAFTAPTGSFCPGSEPVSVIIQNAGYTTIDSMELHWTANGVPQPTVHYTGTLIPTINPGPGQSSDTVTLGNYSFPVNTPVTIKAWTALPNGDTDTLNTNDTIVKIFRAAHFHVSADDSSICPFTQTILHLIPDTGYQEAIIGWQSSLNGISWTNISGSNNVNHATGDLTNETWYKAKISGLANCFSDSLKITLLPRPAVNLGNDTAICQGQSITFNAQNPGDQYLWNTGAVTQSITTTDSGSYSVTVTNGLNCFTKDTIHLAFMPNPHVDGFNFIPQFYDQLGQVKFSLLVPTAVQSCKWDFGDGTPESTDTTPTHTFPVNGGVFTVSVTVYNECDSYKVSLPIQINTETGIVKIAEPGDLVNIYPNPSTGLVNIQTEKDNFIQEVFIYDRLGRQVLQNSFGMRQTNQVKVNTGDMASGVYLIQVKTKKGWSTRKFDLMR